MLLLLRLLPLLTLVTAQISCTVRSSGASSDDTPALLSAIKRCSKITIPKATTLNIGTRLNMTGLSNKHLSLQGTLRFTPDIPYWTGNAFYFPFQTVTTFWIFGGKNLRIDGGGTVDGNGQAWWDAWVTNSTLVRPISFTIYQAKDVVIKNVKFINSPNWFTLTNEATNVEWSNIIINATSINANRPRNSDGWDILRSDNITIRDSVINAHDDCVSFKPNSTNVKVSNLNCNGTHGISVGSLGQYPGQHDIVQNITARNITMTHGSDGARIKAWAGPDRGTGLVKNILYKDFKIDSTVLPLTIDQCYFTNATACAEYPSNVYIEDIRYVNISGTSTGNRVTSLLCSPGGRCKDVSVDDIALKAGSGTTTYACQNIALSGNSAGLFPEACRAAV